MQTEPTAYNHSHILHQVIARSCVKACTSAVAWVRPCYETFVAVKQRRMGCKSRPQLMEETWQRNASDGEPSYVFAWTTAFFQPRVASPCQESVIEVKHARCGANRIYEFDHSYVPHRQIRCSGYVHECFKLPRVQRGFCAENKMRKIVSEPILHFSCFLRFCFWCFLKCVYDPGELPKLTSDPALVDRMRHAFILFLINIESQNLPRTMMRCIAYCMGAG